MKENIERLFLEDIREKKRTGNGIYSRKGKGVKNTFSGGLKTPYYYMSQKQKNQLSGEITMTNLYSSILPLNEFILKDKDMQFKLLTAWRENHNNKLIMEQMGIKGAQKFADLMNELNIPKKKTKTGGRPPKASRTAKVANITAIKSEPVTDNPQAPEIIRVESQSQTQETQEIRPKGLALTYDGDYSPEQLQKLFSKLQILTEDEPTKFRLFISLEELGE